MNTLVKSAFKMTLVAAMALGFSACGIGVENSQQYSAENDRNNKALEETFSRAVGIYEGKLSSRDGQIVDAPGSLTVFTQKVNEGTFPDGTTKTRLAIYARFRLNDKLLPTDYTSITGSYTTFGALSLSSENTAAPAQGGGSGAGSAGPKLSIVGNLAGEQAVVDISRNLSSVWGRFQGTRVTDDTGAPAGGDEDDYRERLLRVYRRMEGIYQGVADSGTERVKVEILLTIVESRGSGTGQSYPTLIGQYRRLDFPSGIGERSLEVIYDSLTSNISMRANEGGGTVPGSGVFSASGTWNDQTLNVTLRDRKGYAGQFVAKRKPLRD